LNGSRIRRRWIVVCDVATLDIGAGDLMLATKARAPFSREGWLFEIKYDGFRALIRKDRDRVELISRNGKLMNASFPDVIEAIAAVPGSFVWDAELTVDEQNGRPSFERLQKRAVTKLARNVRAAIREHPARLYVFDILMSGRRDLRKLSLTRRKAILRDGFENTAVLVCPTSVEIAGEFAFEQACLHDLEGVMAKRLASTYQGVRSLDWLKVKNPDYSRPAALGFGRTAR
jgi:bifunctional non-homologous end joining protein LigD